MEERPPSVPWGRAIMLTLPVVPLPCPLQNKQLLEDRFWNTATSFLMLTLHESQLAAAMLHSWPFMPRYVQICAAKLGSGGSQSFA